MRTIAIIGGGAAGALTAAMLLRRLGAGNRIVIVEPSPEVGRGAAYGTLDPGHLLNVRARDMGAFPDDPLGFCRWLVSEGFADEANVATIFASRKAFGAYVGEVLRDQQAKSGAELTVLREAAQSIADGSPFEILTSSGRSLFADEVVLAIGLMPPRSPSVLRSLEGNPGYIANPWRTHAFANIQPDDEVLIVGTGLTMVDSYLTLAAMGHRGKIFARSRRGLLPRSHQLGERKTIALAEVSGDPVRSVTRLLREAGDEWRSVIDGLRPHLTPLWQSLTWPERARFIRKIRPFWDVHRHRIAEQTSVKIEDAKRSGALSVGVGRISAVAETERGLDVQFADTAETLSVKWIVNCTGPTLDVRSERVPLLESVVDAGLGGYDPLGFGLMVDNRGKVGDSGRLWALGPLCRGCYWETTAIPEIRAQATRISEDMSAHEPRG